MLPINQVKETLLKDYPQFTLVQGDIFKWESATSTVFYCSLASYEDLWSLLHEISHGILHHQVFNSDIELIQAEREAWELAQKISLKYQTNIRAAFIQDSLDSYRYWLHTRSQCPQCGQNGFQQTQNTYSCINCRCLWRTNEARLCRLQRTKLRGQDRSE